MSIIKTTKYGLYELYELIDGELLPMGEYKAVVIENNSKECGYSPTPPSDCNGAVYVGNVKHTFNDNYGGYLAPNFGLISGITRAELSSCCTSLRGQKMSYLDGDKCWYTLLVNAFSYITTDEQGHMTSHIRNELKDGITLSDGIETIDNYALINTTFTDLVLPNSVTKIESYAFIGDGFNQNRNLTALTLSDNIEVIDDSAFDSMNFTQVTYKGITYTKVFDLMQALKDNGVEFGEHTFHNCGLEKSDYNIRDYSSPIRPTNMVDYRIEGYYLIKYKIKYYELRGKYNTDTEYILIKTYTQDSRLSKPNFFDKYVETEYGTEYGYNYRKETTYFLSGETPDSMTVFDKSEEYIIL